MMSITGASIVLERAAPLWWQPPAPQHAAAHQHTAQSLVARPDFSAVLEDVRRDICSLAEHLAEQAETLAVLRKPTAVNYLSWL
jgi:hypothetical protein